MIDSPVVFDVAVFLVILVGFGLVVRPSLVARRRDRRILPLVETPPDPDGAAAWTVDRALKALAATATREGVMLPPVVAVTVDRLEVGIRPATPTAAPPAPWTSSSDGLLWTARHDALQVVAVEETTRQPFPGLVTVGITRDGRMLLDFDEARGLISLQGELVDRRALAVRLVREVTTNPWSATVPVLAVGLPELALPGVDTTADVDDVIAAVREEERGVAFLRDAPVGPRGTALYEELSAGSSGWSVIVVDTARYARWRFTAERDGRITSDTFPDSTWSPRNASEMTTA